MKVSCKTYLSSSVLYTPNKTKNDLHMLHINSVINNLSLHASKSKWKQPGRTVSSLSLYLLSNIFLYKSFGKFCSIKWQKQH